MKVQNTKPFIKEDDFPFIEERMKEALRSGMLTNSKNVKEFEDRFAEYVGVKHAIATNNCLSGLQILMKYFKVKEKEVIVPTNTFIATAHAAYYEGAKPVMADIDPDMLCIDIEDLKRKINKNTAAVIIVHIAGLICPDIYEIKKLCEEKGIPLIEDAAHAHGATLNGKKAGSFGMANAFSFYPTKPMTTGEGGMITTDSEDIDKFARIIRNYGMTASNFCEELGSNWRMPEASAIIGLTQLKTLDEGTVLRNSVAERYKELEGLPHIKLIKVPGNMRHGYFKYPVIIDTKENAAKIFSFLSEKGIDTVNNFYYPPVHLQPIYKKIFGFNEGMLPVAEDVLRRVICLPMFPQITDEQLSYVIVSVKEAVGLL